MGSSGKIIYVLGTRPEAIKLAPLIIDSRAKSGVVTRVVSTGQHRELLAPILTNFGIVPDFDLQLMAPGQDLATLQTKISQSLIPILAQEKPDWLVVQGDTQTCMAAALTSYFLHIPVAHVEAGLRTGDLNAPWPEEFNRRVAALCARVHFAPTEVARNNLLREGIAESDVHITGNTGIDAQLRALDMMKRDAQLNRRIMSELPQVPSEDQIVLATIHRREAHGAPLRQILRALVKLVSSRPRVHVFLPVHRNPKVLEAVNEVLMKAAHPRVHLLPPLDYFPFLMAMSRATVILTDSGGVQEEAPTLRKPVLVLRETTERAEAVEAGCAQLVGFDENVIFNSAVELLDHADKREAMFAKGNPFGDGRATERILQLLLQPALRKTG